MANKQANGGTGLSAKVSEKGAVSIYGVRSRFPVTLYESELRAILAVRDNLYAFMDKHKDALKGAPQAGRAVTGTTAL